MGTEAGLGPLRESIAQGELMSSQHVMMVQKFLACLQSTKPNRMELDMLAADVRYDWFAAQDMPVKRSLVGRAEVEGYVSLLPRTYQVLEADEQSFSSTPEKVVVMGGERARIVRTGRLVHAEWIAVFKIESDRIQHVAMTIHHWRTCQNESPLWYSMSGSELLAEMS